MNIDPASFTTRVAAALMVLAVPGAPGAYAETPSAAAIRSSVEAGLPDAIALYRDFLALPNDAHSPDDIETLVAWLEAAFGARGFETARIDTAGAPILLAERMRDPEDRTLLVYLQADGQPVDPAAWDQADPYLPVLKERDETGSWAEIPWERLDYGIDPDWRVFARSAADSKGPMTQFLTAVERLDASGFDPDYNLKVLVDTEEELGSPHLADALSANRERFAADMLLVFDGPPHVSGEPTVVFGARGIATATITTYGPEVAQHSGHYGNFIPNPAFRLAQLLASMKAPDGRVMIDGFYDGVEIDAATRATLDAVPDDEAAILHAMGVAAPEAVGDSLQESIQYPSLNIRGLSSGWVGAAARTIIPPQATAELDVRLVADSNAEQLLESIRTHIERQGYVVLDRPPTAAERREHARIATYTYDIAYGAFRSDFDAPPGRIARRGMRHLYGEEPILIRSLGGSVPIAPIIDVLDVPAALVPTVNPDNNQHSPNENLRLGDFVDGIAILMSVLSQPSAPTADSDDEVAGGAADGAAADTVAPEG
jgi:acetylornithine deacetylase/succinyl-diaminopimelate desuccinylase-like protein